MDKSKIDICVNESIKEICEVYLKFKQINIYYLIKKYNLIYNYDDYKKNELERFIYQEK